MPKIIDRDAYRAELAQRAAALFSRDGYSALGMRQIASELGISKSALYHYFPSKQDLFSACTIAVTQGVNDQTQAIVDAAHDMDVPERMAVLRKLYDDLAPGIAGEMSLLLDYLRNRDAAEIATDEPMQIANRRFGELFTALAGPGNAHSAYCTMLGSLLQRHFDGGATGFDDIAPALERMIELACHTTQQLDTRRGS